MTSRHFIRRIEYALFQYNSNLKQFDHSHSNILKIQATKEVNIYGAKYKQEILIYIRLKGKLSSLLIYKHSKILPTSERNLKETCTRIFCMARN